MHNNNNNSRNNKMFVCVKSLLMLHLVLSSYQLAPTRAQPVESTTILNFKDDIVEPNQTEIDDMNNNLKVLEIPAGIADGYSAREFLHRDEDQQRLASDATIADKLNANSNDNINLDNLKYDVEMLESSSNDQQSDRDELEEHFRGAAALQVNTNTFPAENIEVGSNNSEKVDDVEILIAPRNRLTLTIILVAVAMVSIGLYAALVIWRSHLEQRYGMRQLLVTVNDEDYFVAEHHRQGTASSTVYA